MTGERSVGEGCIGVLAGQYFDKELNTHYNYYRDYDPSIGRYVQSDPIGLAGGINTYAYVGGNPLSNVDPTGENPAVIAGAILGGIAGGGGAIASGGSGMQIVSGTVFGAASGAALAFWAPVMLVKAGLQLGAPAVIGARVGSSVMGNVVGQAAASINNPCFNPNFQSLAGAGIAGAFAGVYSVSTFYYGRAGLFSANSILLNNQTVASRMFIGTPPALAAIGAASSSAQNTPSNCTCSSANPVR